MQNESFDPREAEKQLNELFRQYLGEDQPGKAEQKKIGDIRSCRTSTGAFW